MASIEAIASSRNRTKDVVRTESLIPGNLRENSSKLIKLLEDYYTFLNSSGNPSRVINEIHTVNDIDDISHQYLNKIKHEIAASIPNSILTNKVKFYKNIMKYYSMRGSQESILTFFKILFDDTVEVYYPKDDMLIPSSGKWDGQFQKANGNIGAYLDNNGFLSDTKKIQDSVFYQKFSYVIRTGNNVIKWRDVFNKLVHPAGFIFFGQILILIELLRGKSAMPYGKVNGEFLDELKYLQPGMIWDEDLPVIILLGFANAGNEDLHILRNIVSAFIPTLKFEFMGMNQYSPKEIYNESIDYLKFSDPTPVGEFFHLTPDELINNTKLNSIGTTITQKSII